MFPNFETSENPQMTPPIVSSSPIPNGHGLGQGEEKIEDHDEFADPENSLDFADFDHLYSSTQSNPAPRSMEFEDVLTQPLGAPVGAHTDYLHRYDNFSSHLRNGPATPGVTPGGNQGWITPQFVPLEEIQGTTTILRSGDLLRDENDSRSLS